MSGPASERDIQQSRELPEKFPRFKTVRNTTLLATRHVFNSLGSQKALLHVFYSVYHLNEKNPLRNDEVMSRPAKERDIRQMSRIGCYRTCSRASRMSGTLLLGPPALYVIF
jgi:hypothetical protein